MSGSSLLDEFNEMQEEDKERVFYLIARLYDNGELWGYRAIEDETDEIMDIDIETAISYVRVRSGEIYLINAYLYGDGYGRGELYMNYEADDEWKKKMPELVRGEHGEFDRLKQGHERKVILLACDTHVDGVLKICNGRGEVGIVSKYGLNEYYAQNRLDIVNTGDEILPPRSNLFRYVHNEAAGEYRKRCRAIGLPEMLFVDSVEYAGEPILVGYVDNAMATRDLVVPDFVVQIGEDTFRAMPWIERIKIGAGVKIIGHNAFTNCGDVEVYLNEGLERISFLGFSDCAITNTLVIPSTVKTIMYSAFEFGYVDSIQVKSVDMLEDRKSLEWIRCLGKDGLGRACRFMEIREELAVKILRFYCLHIHKIPYSSYSGGKPIKRGIEEEVENGADIVKMLLRIGHRHKDPNCKYLKVPYSEAEKAIWYLVNHGKYGVEKIKIVP